MRSLLLFLLSLTAVACSGGKTNQESYVYQTCIDKVFTQLKAPSTAVFSAINETKIEQKLDTYVNDGVTRGKWSVAGYVDSQNSYGAQLRASFKCEFAQWKTEIKLTSATI